MPLPIKPAASVKSVYFQSERDMDVSRKICLTNE